MRRGLALLSLLLLMVALAGCAATLIPEVICNLIMLALVVFTFYQSQHVSLKTLSANSAYQSGTELRWEFSSLDCIFLFLFSHC